MKKFEYSRIVVTRGLVEDNVEDHIMEALKHQGELGWEAIAVAYSTTGATIFFKRARAIES